MTRQAAKRGSGACSRGRRVFFEQATAGKAREALVFVRELGGRARAQKQQRPTSIMRGPWPIPQHPRPHSKAATHRTGASLEITMNFGSLQSTRRAGGTMRTGSNSRPVIRRNPKIDRNAEITEKSYRHFWHGNQGDPFSASITARGPVPILSATCCWGRTVSNRDCAGIVGLIGGGFARKTSRLDPA
jgi:hypothetical protein